MATTAADVKDSSGGRRQWRMTTTAMAENNNGNRGQQQQQTTTGADNDGMQDCAADYKGEGGEQVVNNNGIRACRAESMKKIKKSSLCIKTFFSNRVMPVGFFAPAKTPNGIF